MRPAQAVRVRHHKKPCSAIILGALVIFLVTCAHFSGRLVGTVPSFSFAGHAARDDEWIVVHGHGPQPSPARELIERTKEAARQLAAGTGGNKTRADEAIRAWGRRNPCRSRAELLPRYDLRKRVRQLPPNPLWEELLAEYSKLHSACRSKISNLTHHFRHGASAAEAGCKFAVADVAPNTGLGNKAFVLASSLLYAVLTRRVLLVPADTAVPACTCEPFPGSSWELDEAGFPLPRYHKNLQFKRSEWAHDVKFFERIDERMGTLNLSMRERFSRGGLVRAAPLERRVAVLSRDWQPSNRFYCATEQAFYSQAPWVYLSGCIYTVPKLFASPAFRSTLEDLFPDRTVVTQLLRSAFLPADDVWARVGRIDSAYFAGADRRVGIQVRYKDGEAHYQRMNGLVNERITDCTQRHAILPSPTNYSESSSSGKPVVKVLVASLFLGLADHLSGVYVRHPTAGAEDVALVQVSHGKVQVLDDLEEDRQAFAEVIALSLSDQLLVTPLSTFGGLAQAYGALTPWFVEMREDEALPSCGRGQTVDACNQFTDKSFRCPHDVPVVDGKLFAEVVPYVKDCLSIDHEDGIQLITDF